MIEKVELGYGIWFVTVVFELLSNDKLSRQNVFSKLYVGGEK
jgi:hypothetical protein